MELFTKISAMIDDDSFDDFVNRNIGNTVTKDICVLSFRKRIVPPVLSPI